jgi:hypothetical protein
MIELEYGAYGEIDFGDPRISRRLEQTLTTLQRNPGASICSASSDRYEAKGIYRLVKNPKFEIEAMLKTSRRETIKKIERSGEKIILLPQDTSELCYTGLKECEGLGTHRGKNSRGVIAHSSIAVSPSGLVYGLLSQELWTRDLEEHDKAKERKAKEIEEKESQKWLETMEKSLDGLPGDIKGVTVCDREGDIYELFRKADWEEKWYLVRIVQNRLTEENAKLIDYVKNLDSSGICVVQIPRDTRNKRKAREAKLSIKYSLVTVKAPRNSGYGSGESITAWVIAAEEIDAPENVEPIAWYLLTNVSVHSLDDAYEKVQWYVQRWKIERFHYVWKEVCKVEKAQERDVERLKKVIVLKSIVAMSIMCLMYLSRVFPDIPCDCIFEDDDWKFLYTVVNNTTVFPP